MMGEAEIEKAYNTLALHHSELLLENMELRKQMRNTSIWRILKLRWYVLIGKDW